jgi:beta-1,4-mannosyltransferase
MTTPPVRVASLPESTDNPYYALFYGALARAGIEHVSDAEYDLEWFRTRRQSIDWVHFHWVQSYYSGNSLRLTITRGFRLIGFILRLRSMGFPLVWTCHNLLPHERRSLVMDYLVRIALAHTSRIVVVHSEAARRSVGRYFGRFRRIVVIRHGHVVGWYPGQVSRDEARRRLGIAEGAFVLLCFGIVRPYKGVEALIDAVRSRPDGDMVLLVAGKPMTREYGETLAARAAGDPRICLRLGYVPDAEVQSFFRAADLGILAFRSILTSGSLVLYLSMGLPVIVPHVPSVLEYVDERCAYVMRPGDDLAASIASARDRHKRGEFASEPEIVAWARSFDWDTEVAPLVALLSRRPA